MGIIILELKAIQISLDLKNKIPSAVLNYI